MNRFLKPIRAAVILLALLALTGCIGQAATPSTPTVDINAIKTAAAATAIVELTKIAAQASPTLAPTKTPTTAPATPTLAATQAAGSVTPGTALSPTATIAGGGAAGLPATQTPLAPMAGTAAPIPSLTPLVAPTSAGPTCLNSKFVTDVTVPDGTVMQPGQKFTKGWRIQNTGTCTWDEGYGFVRWSGPDMGAADQYFSKNDQPVGAGGVVDFYVDMRAPYEAGDYVAHWVMVSDTGKTFGGDFTVVIKVVK